MGAGVDGGHDVNGVETYDPLVPGTKVFIKGRRTVNAAAVLEELGQSNVTLYARGNEIKVDPAVVKSTGSGEGADAACLLTSTKVTAMSPDRDSKAHLLKTIAMKEEDIDFVISSHR